VLRFISFRVVCFSLLEEERAMLLKRTKALSSEIFFRIDVIDGAATLLLAFSI
jgi:hypothetical protein